MRSKAPGFTFFCLLLLCARFSPAITTTNLTSVTPQQLAQQLAGPGVTVSNVTFTGANVAGGTFSGGLADGLGIESGVMLSSGDIANGVGPNDSDGIGTCHGLPGDANLNAILGKDGFTEDAAVLEFDFIPATSNVSFRYVFASEEYNEFVNSINDIFAFFIDGQNVALIPSTTTPVSINTVNLTSNSSFYRNNDPSDLGMPTPFGTQYDGFTTVLTAMATLTPSVSHHIKLVIADNSDCILDSAVFLQAGSFVGQPTLTVSKSAPASVASGSNLTYTITYGNTGTENATNVVIRDPIPAGTSFVSATNGGVLTAGVVTWNVGTVNAGVTGQTVSFTVAVNATSGSVTNSNYTIEATGISPVTGSPVATTVVAGCPTITLSPEALPNGAQGAFYSQTLTASGGTGSYFFSLVGGAPPPGLLLSSSGLLSGTPTADGSYSFTVQATDSSECSGSRGYSVTITPSGACPTITLSPPSLSDGSPGVPYAATIRASGGTAPYSFTVLSGALPPGLSLSAGGSLSGTPTATGTFSFRIRARDASGCLGSRTYTVTMGCTSVVLSPAALAAATAGTAYSQALTASGGQAPYTFAVTGGALPPGMTLAPGGILSGTPTGTGSFSFTVRATDPGGCTGTRDYTLLVCPVLAVSPASLAAATVGVAYSQALGASGGSAPYGFAVTGGALPPDLALSGAGVLSGTPSAAGNFSFTVTATDAGGCAGARTYSLSVCPVVTINPASLPPGAVGSAYSQTLTAIGGTGPYVFAAAGSLPPGLALSSGGVLTGTPTQSGAFTFDVTATDVNGCAGRRTYPISVTDAPPTITALRLSPGAAEGFTLSVMGTGFAAGSTIVVNGTPYPATFVSPTLVTVMLPASAIPPTGTITVTVTNPGPTGTTSNPASLTLCTAPGAPRNPTIVPLGNPTGPLTATDFLVVRWDPPATGPVPASYEFRINGGAYASAAGTSAVVDPRGNNDPITLHVRARCNDSVTGPEASSPTYSLAPPVANFTFSAARVGSPVTFTDTSSPQATSWLWIFDDGATSTLQSPTHTFATAGTHRVALIASNGSGTSQVIKDVLVSAATTGSGAAPSSTRAFATSDGERWTLEDVPISAGGALFLHVAAEGAGQTVVYLRFLDPEGRLVLERRLAIAEGESASNDVAAYGLAGIYRLELVSSRPIDATLRRPLDLGSKRSKPNE
jgi:uncharacterized repeat protein (TIGR01451 family)